MDILRLIESYQIQINIINWEKFCRNTRLKDIYWFYKNHYYEKYKRIIKIKKRIERLEKEQKLKNVIFKCLFIH